MELETRSITLVFIFLRALRGEANPPCWRLLEFLPQRKLRAAHLSLAPYHQNLFFLACMMLLAAGCGGGGVAGGGIAGGGGVTGGSPTPGEFAPTLPSPVELGFRPVDLGAPAPPDGVDYRTREFRQNHGLAAISADKAYERGYFGQGVTIAVAESGMDSTHPDLAGRTRAPFHVNNQNDQVFEPDLGGPPLGGHGTYVALIAAGARENDSAENFEIKVVGRDPIPTPNVHGVAPQASIMPISIHGGGPPQAAVRHAAANQAQVVNFSLRVSSSYYGEYAGREGVWLTSQLPLFGPTIGDGIKRDFAEMADAAEQADIVMVWAAGNESWNSRYNKVHMCGKNHIDEDGCQLGDVSVTAQEFMQKFTWLPDPDDLSRKISFKDMWGTDCGRDDCADYNSGGGWKEAPLFEPRLLGKWLAVGALDENGEIAFFSNGCGAARNWCLFAPGENLAIGPGGSGISGTSFAAPHVSGALAVLKSRLPSMPMEVVQAVLLVSADPLGTRLVNPQEPDPVFGWGRLNLGNAINMQGTVQLPYTIGNTTQSVALRDARITLPHALAHVGYRMQSVNVAVGGVGSAYYNMKLSGIVEVEAESPPLGHVARGMLAPASGYRVENNGAFVELDHIAGRPHTVGVDFADNLLGRWQLRHELCNGCEKPILMEWGASQLAGPVFDAPFFDRPDGAFVLQMKGNGLRPFAAVSGWESERAPWRQFGLQWRQLRDGFGIVAELSRIDENRSIWGATFGALGDIRTETLRKQLFLSGPLGEKWRGFASYEHNSGEVPTTGGMVAGISGLRAEGWSVGTRGSNIFRGGDTLRLSVQQQTRVRNGKARISRLVAAGSSFVEAFYLGQPQSLQRQETTIDLRVRPTTRYSLGYALPVEKSAQLAFGLEYEGESRKSGISVQWRRDF